MLDHVGNIEVNLACGVQSPVRQDEDESRHLIIEGLKSRKTVHPQWKTPSDRLLAAEHDSPSALQIQFRAAFLCLKRACQIGYFPGHLHSRPL